MSEQSTWSDSGYVTESPYMRDYIRYQSPVTMAFAAATNGFAYPDYSKQFRYCDLGCGEAVTTLTLAAAYPHGQFVGVDLNAEQISNARALAQEAGLVNVTFLATDFADPDLQGHGPFDFVAAHGIYSWVAPEVQQDIHRFIDDALAPGGLFYFCHYVRPGSGRIEAVFHLIQSLLADTSGPLEHRARSALAALRELEQYGAPLFEYHRSIKRFIQELERRDPRYLIHEFCNQYFHPRYFPEISRDLRALDCHYVGSTRFERNSLDTQFGEGIPPALQGIGFATAEERASLLTVDQFRWDVFRRTDGQDDGQKAIEARLKPFYLDATNFPYSFTKETTLWDKEVTLETDVMNRLADLLQDGRRSIGAALRDESLADWDYGKRIQTLFYMVGAGDFVPTTQAASNLAATSSQALIFSHGLSPALARRDLLREGFITLPSLNCGSTIGLRGFEGMAAVAHDGRSTAQAEAYLREWLESLEGDVSPRIKRAEYQDPEAFDRAWGKFLRQTLPQLRKHQILIPA